MLIDTYILAQENSLAHFFAFIFTPLYGHYANYSGNKQLSYFHCAIYNGDKRLSYFHCVIYSGKM